MKTVLPSAMALSLMLTAAPVAAAVIVDPNSEDSSAAMSVTASVAPSNASWTLEQKNETVAEGSSVTVFNDVISTYASMLPAPADWVLMLTGFGVIGYAMRSRKRGRVSFN